MAYHKTNSTSYTLTTSLATTPEITYGGEYGMIYLDTDNAASVTELTFHVAPEPGGTYEALYDDAGAEVDRDVTHSKAYPLPDALRGCGCFKIVPNAAGTVIITTWEPN